VYYWTVIFIETGQVELAIMGAGIAQRLNVDHRNPYEALNIYLPNRKQRGPLDKTFKERLIL
jgi:hypothetical protein